MATYDPMATARAKAQARGGMVGGITQIASSLAQIPEYAKAREIIKQDTSLFSDVSKQMIDKYTQELAPIYGEDKAHQMVVTSMHGLMGQERENPELGLARLANAAGKFDQMLASGRKSARQSEITGAVSRSMGPQEAATPGLGAAQDINAMQPITKPSKEPQAKPAVGIPSITDTAEDAKLFGVTQSPELGKLPESPTPIGVGRGLSLEGKDVRIPKVSESYVDPGVKTREDALRRVAPLEPTKEELDATPISMLPSEGDIEKTSLSRERLDMQKQRENRLEKQGQIRKSTADVKNQLAWAQLALKERKFSDMINYGGQLEDARKELNRLTDVSDNIQKRIDRNYVLLNDTYNPEKKEEIQQRISSLQAQLDDNMQQQYRITSDVMPTLRLMRKRDVGEGETQAGSGGFIYGQDESDRQPNQPPTPISENPATKYWRN